MFTINSKKQPGEVLEFFLNLVSATLSKTFEDSCFFCEYQKIIKNAYFEESLRTAVSE